MKINEEHGFTLIELLVVIFIIGILAALILPNFVSTRERARDARRKQDLNQIKNALGIYYNDNQSYPLSLTFGSSWAPYMQQIPQDPLNKDDNVYYYRQIDNGNGFILRALLENRSDPDADQSVQKCGVAEPSDDPYYYVCTY